MALSDQPYIPFYVDDFISDEKVRNCSASALGVYWFILCLMHKSSSYGRIKLLDMYKKDIDETRAFSQQLSKQFPFEKEEIFDALSELILNEICYIKSGYLCQKRMIEDGEKSANKAKNGRKGGKANSEAKTKQTSSKQVSKSEANFKQNTVNEIVTVNGTETVLENENKAVSETHSETISQTKPLGNGNININNNKSYGEKLNSKIKDWFTYKGERAEYPTPLEKKELFEVIDKQLVNGESYIIDMIQLAMSNGYKGIQWKPPDRPPKSFEKPLTEEEKGNINVISFGRET